MTPERKTYRLARDPTYTEMLSTNIGAAVTYMSVAVGHRQDGGGITKQSRANLKIIKRWSEMLLNGEIPQPGDGVSE
jgi:hypothetical protein